MATIFLSHSSRDDALASSIERWLKANGFTDLFVDHDSIRAGDKWAEELRRAKGSCRVVLCLATPHWLASDECYGEFKACWYLGRRVIPLFALGDATLLDDRQRGRLERLRAEDQGIGLGAIADAAAFSLDQNHAAGESLKAGLRAAGALARVGLDPAAFEVNKVLHPEPFPGLASFSDTDSDAAVFFGRSPEIAQCLEDLREMRATGDRRAYAIQGASGSGKSSLLQAGVMPRLRRERGWFVLRSFRPGADPLFNFADAIARTAVDLGINLAGGAIRDELLAARRSKDDLRATLDRIIAPLKRRADRQSATVLIAMDQGEELARAGGDSADALGDYLRAGLGDAPEAEPISYLWSLTVRSDSFNDLQTSPHFVGILLRACDIRTLPVYRFDMAIEQPAARYGVEIEPDLVDALMQDASGSDVLPLLAFTLQRLWRQYGVQGRIRKIDYNNIGKLSGIIADAAERALRNVDPLGPQAPLDGKVPEAVEKRAAKLFVPRFAQLNDRGATIRRVTPMSVFDDEEKALIKAFAQWRLVTISADHAEVAHEALFREWPRFADWLEPERARLAALRGLESAAANWSARGKKREDLMHRGRRLSEARALESVAVYKIQLDEISEAIPYLAACQAGQHRRRLIAGGIGLALFALAIPELFHIMRVQAAAMARSRAVAAAEAYKPESPILVADAELTDTKPGDVFRDCADCPEMVVLPPGSLPMGSPPTDPDAAADEKPQHDAKLPAYAIGKFDVTFDEWAACAKDGGCTGNPEPNDFNAGRGRRPVIGISWNDAQEYVRWLAGHAGKPYRLPSEAEWEYAARGGTTTRYYTGDSIDESQANFNVTVGMTEPDGSYPANPFGLYDMAGNAWQWVEDCYNTSYNGAPSDGRSWDLGDCSRRMIRGGDWYDGPNELRSANRNAYLQSDRLPHATLRVVRPIPAKG
jgi:formylglycine-generating enzyme required for sulfatase activity